MEVYNSLTIIEPLRQRDYLVRNSASIHCSQLKFCNSLYSNFNAYFISSGLCVLCVRIFTFLCTQIYQVLPPKTLSHLSEEHSAHVRAWMHFTWLVHVRLWLCLGSSKKATCGRQITWCYVIRTLMGVKMQPVVINVTKECEHKKRKTTHRLTIVIRLAYVLCPYNEARRDDELNG